MKWLREKFLKRREVTTLVIVGILFLTRIPTSNANYNMGMFWRLAAFTQFWKFTTGTDAEYLFGLSVEIAADKVSLIFPDQTDDDASLRLGFGGGTGRGVAWDSTGSVLRLHSGSGCDGRSTACGPSEGEMNSSWAPQWGNLKAYWKLNETSGSVSDSSPTGLAPLTVNGGGVMGTPGKFNNSIRFNGTTAHINIGTPAALDGLTNGSFTYAAWAKPAAVPASDCSTDSSICIGRVIGRPGYHSGISYSYTGSFDCTHWLVAGSGAVSLGATATVNEWHHIVMSVDNTNKLVHCILDGVPVAGSPGSYAGMTSFNHSGGNYTIGISDPYAPLGHGNYPFPFQGDIDEVAIWGSALSPAEAALLYQRQVARYSGTFTSRVMDAFSTGLSWTTFSWTTPLPFGKELPAPGSSETSASYPSLVGSTGSLTDNNLTQGLVGLWHFNEAAPTGGGYNDFADATGLAHAGEIVSNGATTDTGIVGRGVQLNGSGHIEIADAADLRGMATLTFAVWVNLSNFPAQNSIPMGSDYGTNYRFVIASNGHASVVVTTANNSWYSPGTATGSPDFLTLNEWHLLVGTYDGSLVRLYVDGVLKGTGGQIISGAISNNPAIFTFGYGGYANLDRYQGKLDEGAVWRRALHASEIQQLYRRGANRLKHQVRICTAADCSDDASGAAWKGPDGTNTSYFSELNNNTLASAMTGAVKAAAPSLLFSDFTSPVGTSRYFQYRTIFESDDVGTTCNYGSGATACSPELKSVAVGPVRTNYDTSAPTVIGVNGVNFNKLETFTETLGVSCASGVKYNLGMGTGYGTAVWYYWDTTKNAACTAGGSGGWCTADGTVAKASTAAEVQAGAPTFAARFGRGKVFFKAYLQSSGSSVCELDELSLKVAP